MSAKNDTVRIGHVIAVKMRTERDIREFEFLMINGLVVKAERIATSEIDKIVFFKLDKECKG